jgi:hypothetical protein
MKMRHYPRRKNHRNNNNYSNNNPPYYRQNKYDKSYNSIEKISEQIFYPINPINNYIPDTTLKDPPKIENLNKDALPYYPLPTNEGYELFLQHAKKDLYKKRQYSFPFMLSLREKFKDKPENMGEIKIPQKNEIRSRAKIVTEEAYRVTRNYLDENSDRRNFSIAYVKRNELSEEELKNRTMILREMLNKICDDNYNIILNEILKFDYDEKLLDIFKNLLIEKILTEDEYFTLYVNICAQMCKLYNKKTYSNEQKMNFKNLLLASIQQEFLNLDETSIKYIPPIPVTLGEKSKKKFIKKIKYSNINLISEFYNIGLIRKNIIKDCIDELIQKNTNFSISLLCHLIIKISKKLFTDLKESLDQAYTYLDKIEKTPPNFKIEIETKFEIMEVLESKDKLINIENLNETYENLGAKPINYNISNRKSSEIRSRRKSSINPKDVEYIKRSRFNSKADELKIQKEDNPLLVDEVIQYLNMDLEFYECFQLNEEECDIVKEYTDKLLKSDLNDKEINNDEYKCDLLEKNFEEMMEEVQCEKFIAVGHMIEIMFSRSETDKNKIINIILYLFKKKLIDDEDIKHGIVLGLVKFKKNIIDYPNTKKYFQDFIDKIKNDKVLDDKMILVYQRCCDSIGKNYE